MRDTSAPHPPAPAPGGLNGLLALAGRLAVRRRSVVLLLAAALTLLCALAGHDVSGRLVNGGFVPDSAPSARAQRTMESFGGGAPGFVLLARTRGTVDAPEARRDGVHLVSRLLTDPQVVGVDSYWTGSVRPRRAAPAGTDRAADALVRALRTADGHTAVVLVRLRGSAGGTRAAVDRLLPEVTGVRGPLRVDATGQAAALKDLEDQSEKDLRTAELIAAPAVLLLLLWAFGSLWAALLPLAVGAVAVAGALAVLRALTTVTEVSVFALNLTTAVGLAMAVDYSLFLVARYREERAAGASHDAALRQMMTTGGRTVVVSAAVVGAALAGLLVFPLYFLRSLAWAGLAVVALAAVTALLLVPAALSCLGEDRAGTDWFARRRFRGATEQGRWYRLAVLSMRRPVAVGVGGLLVLAALALPFHRAVFGLSDERVLPPTASVAGTARVLHTQLPAVTGSSTDVVLPHWQPESPRRLSELDAYASRLSALPGATGVRTVTGVYAAGRPVLSCPAHATDPAAVRVTCTDLAARHRAAAGTWVAVSGPASAYGPASTRLTRDIRSTGAPTAVRLAGPAAELADIKSAIAGRLPYAAGLVALCTLVLLALFTRSLFLPVKALVMNLLSLTATAGGMVWIFQDGHLRFLVGDFTVTGTIDLLTPMVAICLAFGLSMDYEVLLLSRIGEAHTRTRDTARATAAGLQAAAPLFTASAAVVIAVLLALASAQITVIKLIGVTVALSLLIDTLLIRPLLVPAVMALAGPVNWWLPSRFRRERPAVPPPVVPAPASAVGTAPGAPLDDRTPQAR
ncbi:MMPL family transporter [Streptomyces sp. NBC_01014]|uniref:MMPL family transporter n=1 Tax=Streptomyces sp. NBC_01014 TaxID=2903719 RepID=UPI0038667507|nr:MMPL family transporter [Streptomyces sp. NBC_01014]